MTRIAGLLLLALGSTALMYAQSSSPAKEMNGTICDARCVTQQGDVATCNPTCTNRKSGVAVFVDDQGGVWQIVNQDICRSHMSKRVRMTVVPEKPKIFPTEHQREDWLRIQDLRDMPSR